MKRETLVGIGLIVVVAVAIILLRREHPPEPKHPVPVPVLASIGPRLVSNQTSQPLSLYGSGFEHGMRLKFSGGGIDVSLPLTVVDQGHAYARLPPQPLGPELLQVTTQAQVLVSSATDAGSARMALTVVNDAAFVGLTALVRAKSVDKAFALSSTTDQLFVFDVSEGAVGEVEIFRTADGPSALALWTDEAGAEHVVVTHLYSKELRVYAVAAPGGGARTITAPAMATGIVVDETGRAFVAEAARDTVSAISLSTEETQWTTPVDPNPRELAVCGDRLLAVGSVQAGTINVVDRVNGELVRSITPTPATTIVGGGTQKYSPQIMGGAAPRSFAWSKKHERLLVSSIGPNIGPNADGMEVSMNGGVGVVDVHQGVFVRHLGFGKGVTGALALDDAKGVLYAADPALGLVRAMEVKALVSSDRAAANALSGSVELPVPEAFPRIRPAADFGVKGRATDALHSGPSALALNAEGTALTVLGRFIGDAVTFKLPLSPGAKPRVTQLADTAAHQTTRRLGEILYYADLGQTAMSCDACHLDGHTGGVFFEKTRPMRIYRSNTLRGSVETAPYFTPASTHSLAETAKDVGARNRFHNPVPGATEIEALALYNSQLTLLPNPFVGEDGAPVDTLLLPDGKQGRPRAGMRLFDAYCASCHPSPHFTTDQHAKTRGTYLDVGTPAVFPLRESLQDWSFNRFAPPPLVGSWDVWPMLGTGAAGFSVSDGVLTVGTRFPMREVIEKYPRHGNVTHLSAQEKDDLLAYLMSL